MTDYTRLLLFLSLFLSSNLFAQTPSRFTTQLRVDLIMNGLFESDPDFDSDYTTKNTTIPGPSFAVGAKFGYFLDAKRNVRLNLSSLLEIRNFTRHIVNEYSNQSKYILKNKFYSSYLSVPLELEYHIGKWNIKAGLIGVANLETRFKRTRCFEDPDRDCDYYTSQTISTNILNYKKSDDFIIDKVYADSWLHLQYTLGIAYRIFPKISVGAEYRNFITKNYLHHDYLDWDVFAEEELKQQIKSLHLSMFVDLD